MVLEGKILSKMDDMPEQVYGPGESWYERPGCHHAKVSPSQALKVLGGANTIEE